jgi:pimeloyl-ACP methyl ester carboxylesterase
LALAGLALGALVWWSRRAVRTAEADYPAEGELLDLGDGAVLHVVDRGEGPPLVLIHGSPGALQGMVATVADALAADHRVVMVDRPGHGWSRPPRHGRHDVETNVRMLRAGLARLGVERPVLVGHSYGGATALRWAVEHPDEVAGLVLLAPAAFPDFPEPLWVFNFLRLPLLGRLLTDALVVPIGRLLIGLFEPRAFLPNPAPEAYLGYSRALYLRPATFLAMAEEYRTLPEQLRPLAARYGELRVPTVVIGAAEDRVTRTPQQAERLAREIPEAELVVLPDTGHELFWEHPEAVVEAVRRAEARAT